MFYLDRRRDDDAAAAAAAAAATIANAVKYNSPPSNGEENFGWWLNHWKLAVSPGSRRDRAHRSSGSSASLLSCIDSDDSDGSACAREPLDGRQGETRENIELRTFTRDDLDIELIESDAGETDNWPTTVTDGEYNDEAGNESGAVRCSPGRLIRCPEYWIPAPASRCSSRARRAPAVGSCRARLSCSLVDSESIDGAQPRTTLKPPWTRTRTHATSSPVIANSRRADGGLVVVTRPSEDLADDRERRVQSTETVSSSSRSSYDRLNSSWDDCTEPDAHLYSLEDTSGIQSNDCDSDKRSNTPMSLCDELAIASKHRVDNYTNNRGTAINEVASILESLQNDPEKATVLLEEEDRFCDCRSSHNQLVRLALAIEMDAEEKEEEAPAIPDDLNNWVCQLRDKIERLQRGHKEIRGDIRGLHGDFQRDERRISDVSGNTARLRGEIRELRCLDDLLTLVQGELARISRRNWPFVLGNSEPRGQVNLIV